MFRVLWALACISVAGALYASSGVAEPEPPRAQLVLIIDDLGYNLERGKAALALPGAITYSILPHTPYGKRLAEAAHSSGREVMLHLPMANLNRRPLGPGGLEQGQSRDELLQVMRGALASVPHAQGFNNHMGSLLTQQAQAMQWVMAEAQVQRLFFVDSLTTVNTVAWQVARQYQVPVLKRQVFLDHQPSRAFIHRQFQRGLAIAAQRGLAVMIGHPHDETLRYLRERLPQLAAEGITLTSVSSQLPVAAWREPLAAGRP